MLIYTMMAAIAIDMALSFRVSPCAAPLRAGAASQLDRTPAAAADLPPHSPLTPATGG